MTKIFSRVTCCMQDVVTKLRVKSVNLCRKGWKFVSYLRAAGLIRIRVANPLKYSLFIFFFMYVCHSTPNTVIPGRKGNRTFVIFRDGKQPQSESIVQKLASRCLCNFYSLKKRSFFFFNHQRVSRSQILNTFIPYCSAMRGEKIKVAMKGFPWIETEGLTDG